MKKNILILSYNNDIALFKNLPKNEEEYNSFKDNIMILTGHTDIVRCAVFSPNGKHIVSRSDDNTIRIWDFQTGVCIQTYFHNALLQKVSLTPDGRYFIVCYENKSIEVFKFSTTYELIGETRAWFNERGLTLEERKRYYID